MGKFILDFIPTYLSGFNWSQSWCKNIGSDMPNFLKDKFSQNSPFLENSQFHLVFLTDLEKVRMENVTSFSVDGCHSHFTHQIVRHFRSWILRPFWSLRMCCIWLNVSILRNWGALKDCSPFPLSVLCHRDRNTMHCERLANKHFPQCSCKSNEVFPINSIASPEDAMRKSLFVTTQCSSKSWIDKHQEEILHHWI